MRSGLRPRIFAAAAVGLLAVSLLSPAVALATEEEPAEETTTTTTFAEGEAPAVVVPVEEPEEEEQPWTARFLIPILVSSAILIIAVVAYVYLARVKNRYRVVGS